MMNLDRPQLVILTAVASILVTVSALHFKGYLNHSSAEDAVVYEGFSMILNVPDMEQYVSARAAKQKAVCAQGFLMLESVEGPAKVGLLVDGQRRAIRCDF
ncbi:hypothetical protein [Aestuariirhabdus litorea]|uniref:Lipoprotein n=1 Tax=Aestuariirhabdus litorea TaxID=2528527 RepID=A0A3P3VTC4_9GAMM|nr:hypothetical protein [Aestuariirhabdus litorea]RRJ85218.1 hypothetical protein D0544_09165 [Aestuariirhabdus litorea]RWW98439.1 hypothetical protein DZC74_09150 [Endozoicomonadaceae bacterium GTF-13]